MSRHRNSQAVSIMILLFLLNAISSFAQDSPTAPIPISAVATSYPLSLTRQDAAIQDQIRNTLAHYPLALDGKNFAALSLFYTADAVANYSAPFYVVTGLPAIEAVLEQALRRVLTQHSYGTQVIEIEKGKTRARALTYFTATHFGIGNATGKVCHLLFFAATGCECCEDFRREECCKVPARFEHTANHRHVFQAYYAYGQYQDNLIRTGNGWRVKHRNLVYMVIAILLPQDNSTLIFRRVRESGIPRSSPEYANHRRQGMTIRDVRTSRGFWSSNGIVPNLPLLESSSVRLGSRINELERLLGINVQYQSIKT